MFSKRSLVLVKLLEIQDMVIMATAAVVAIVYHYHSLNSEALNFTFEQIYLINFSLLDVVALVSALILWHQCFVALGLYQSRRLSPHFLEIIDVGKATSISTLIFGVLVFFIYGKMLDFKVISIFWLCATALGVLNRSLMRVVLNCIRRCGRNTHFLIVVGTNEQAINFVDNVNSRPELGYEIIGFVDDCDATPEIITDRGYSVVSGFSDFQKFAREKVIDEVAIFVSIRSNYDRIAEIIDFCEEQGIIVRLRADPFTPKHVYAHSQIGAVGNSSLITFYTGAMQGSQLLIKRIMDIVISSLLLLCVLPIFIIVAILIKATSTGPVFFVQDRVGFNKRRFSMYKFRTMVQGAESKMGDLEHLNEADGPVFKIKNDPRITSIGKILRVTSIDELPQLINVLKGDMSLVGPRPLPVRDYIGFDRDSYRRRFSTRPGITCLWQVSGRSNISFDQWMALDMAYIDEWSLWLDLKILFRTINVVFKGTGAA